MSWNGDSDTEHTLAAKMELHIAEHCLHEAEDYVDECKARVEKWRNELARAEAVLRETT
jgi:hypothetical protein